MHDHDLGLSHDLHIAALRRHRALQWLAALGGSALAGCGGGGDDTSSTDASTTTTTTTATTSTSTCAVVPKETAGPYPDDGSNNNINALVLSGIVRSDIRESFAGATGVAEGAPLTLRLRLPESRQRQRRQPRPHGLRQRQRLQRRREPADGGRHGQPDGNPATFSKLSARSG